LTPASLLELPSQPAFIFCATDLVFGVNWRYSRASVGDYMAGSCTPPSSLLVARAVAASSCFPPVFPPTRTLLAAKQLSGGRFPAGPERERLIAGLRLTDGGVYDNMGLEPVWKTGETVLVSDGGAVFPFRIATTLVRLLKRYADIGANQAAAVRKRWLISNFLAKILTGAYWGIGSSTSSFPVAGVPGYSDPLVKECIAPIRTDMDAFTEAEMRVLENHGYSVAEAAIRSHAPALIGSNADAFRPPHPDWLDESRVRNALGNSSRRYLLGRF
jgi:NTE family protein